MYDYPEIEVKLHELMAKNNIRTIEQLTEISGLSRKPISQALNKKNHRMHTDTIAKLCGALNCEVGDLLVLKK